MSSIRTQSDTGLNVVLIGVRIQMLKSMGAGAGAGGFDGAGPSGADVESDDSDDDGPPPLEEAEPKA